MNSILILHGPNLNLLGEREPEIYGEKTLKEINEFLISLGLELGLEVRTYQSNHEGDLVDTLQNACSWSKGAVVNAAAYTHTSIALHDTIAAVHFPVIEVHISNPFSRETFRHNSLISSVCRGTITGFGWRSYELAIRALAHIIENN